MGGERQQRASGAAGRGAGRDPPHPPTPSRRPPARRTRPPSAAPARDAAANGRPSARAREEAAGGRRGGGVGGAPGVPRGPVRRPWRGGGGGRCAPRCEMPAGRRGQARREEEGPGRAERAAEPRLYSCRSVPALPPLAAPSPPPCVRRGGQGPARRPSPARRPQPEMAVVRIRHTG